MYQSESDLTPTKLAAEERQCAALLYDLSFREAVQHWRNGDLMAMRESLDACRWDLRGPEYGFLAQQAAKTARTLRGHTYWVTALAVSADGQRLYSGSHDRTIKAWDLKTGKEISTRRGHAGGINQLALSRNGQRLFSVGADNAIKVWDLSSVQEIQTLTGVMDNVLGLASSADGQRLFLAGADKTIKVWDVAAGKVVLTFPGHANQIRCLALSPDDRRLASAGGDIKLWDLETGQETLSLPGHGDITCLAWSRDGKRLFTGSTDETIKVWDLDTRQEIRSLRGHTWGITSLARNEGRPTAVLSQPGRDHQSLGPGGGRGNRHPARTRGRGRLPGGSATTTGG